MAPKKTRSRNKVHVAPQQKPRRLTIDILPEEVLLDIFDLYVDPSRKYGQLETWCTLVHVCRKWRIIVLESPLRLDLRIRCNPAKPVREKLDIWPTLPIVVRQHDDGWEPDWGVVNVTEALEQNNRVCQIGLWGVPTWQTEEILAAMDKPFPVLTDLEFWSDDEIDETTFVDPDLFLGGSAPCLRSFQLFSIPFPGLPKLLSSATQLTDLQLYNIPRSGYISPEAMASCVFTLPRLEKLILEFKSPESFPIREHRPPPPPTRTLLPALTQLEFNGISEYLEDLVVRIDTPLLDSLTISFSHQFIPDTPQLSQFINRLPKLKGHNEAQVIFYSWIVSLKLGRLIEKGLGITYEVEDSHVSCVAQVFTSYLFHDYSAAVDCLYIHDSRERAHWRGDIRVEKNHWLELLCPFTSVKSLYLSQVIVSRIASALQELIGERMAGVLPALQTIFLEDLSLSGPVQEAIGSFVSGRQFSGNPVAISHWERE